MVTLPLENVLISTFVYLTGYHAGMKGYTKNATINLYQQTHLDTSLADLFTSLNGRCLLIEFKRSGDDAASEIEKGRKEQILKKLNYSINAGMMAVSKKCHFFAYGEASESYVDILLTPYLSLIEKDASRWDLTAFDAFIDDIFSHPPQFGVSVDKMQKYLDFLFESAGGNGGVANGAAPGIVVAVDDSGAISMYGFDDFQGLDRSLVREPNYPTL